MYKLTPKFCLLCIQPEYLQEINKYTKKQKNWNRRLRKQIMELTGVSTVSLNDVFYIWLYVWDVLCMIIIIWILLHLVGPICKIYVILISPLIRNQLWQLCFGTKNMAPYMNILLLSSSSFS